MARNMPAQATSNKRLKLEQCHEMTLMLQETTQSDLEGRQIVTPTPSLTDSDAFQSLGDDIHGRILSFLVTPSTKNTSRHHQVSIGYSNAGGGGGGPPVNGIQAGSLQDDHYFQQESARLNSYMLLLQCHTLSLVSKEWMNAIGILMNAHVPTKIISPNHLFEVKYRALSLDLQNVCQAFHESIQKKWGRILLDDEGDDTGVCAWNVITTCFGGSEEAFVNIVANEYVKFLVVKSVEKLMCNRAARKETKLMKIWKESCQPPMLVVMFWEAHMTLSPKKYAQDCNILLGDLLGGVNSIDNILDHDPTSLVGWNTIDGSDYQSKKDVLFPFEKGLVRTDTYVGRFGWHGMQCYDKLLFTEWFNAHQTATELWEQMGGE